VDFLHVTPFKPEKMTEIFCVEGLEDIFYLMKSEYDIPAVGRFVEIRVMVGGRRRTPGAVGLTAFGSLTLMISFDKTSNEYPSYLHVLGHATFGNAGQWSKPWQTPHPLNPYFKDMFSALAVRFKLLLKLGVEPLLTALCFMASAFNLFNLLFFFQKKSDSWNQEDTGQFSNSKTFKKHDLAKDGLCFRYYCVRGPI
jgi:hypothetical protein